MPEPLFTETITDLDGYDAGDVEFEVNGSDFRALRGGAVTWQTGPEAEWLVTRQLGIRLEPVVAEGRDSGQTALRTTWGAGGGVSWKLIQDYRHDFHLQTEITARAPWDVTPTTDPGESPLPVTLDLRWGLRQRAWTLRSGVGLGIGSASAHVPLRGSLAILHPFGPSERFGFFGMEADVDGARQNPVVVAIDLVPDMSPLHLPFRLGLGLPWAIGVPANQPALGLFLRIFVESTAERAYGESL
jgi:hypothetical protein